MTRPDDDDIFEQNLTTLLGQRGDSASPDDVAKARMRARLLVRHGRASRARSKVALAGYGLVVAAAGALIIANLRGGADGTTHRAPAADAPVIAKLKPLELPDGSQAELGDGGTLTELGPRRVRIAGPVLLDVAPGQGVFTVETAQGELAVLGTRFLVEADADRTTTSVLRGAVALRSGGAEEVLHAGEQGVMQKGQRPTRGPAPRLSHLVSWVAERRAKDERPTVGPARTGALVARNPQWPQQEFPLPIRALTVDVHLENQVARVALDQTFFNEQDQILEGVYKFALPPGAAVSRLAMYVDGKLTESAVVERMAARRIYEDVVYQRRDPALLEQMGASLVSMRIFPLAPHQDKRVVLAYTQPLARTYDDLTVTVPLPEIETPVGEVGMQVKIVGCAACEITSASHRIDVVPSGADAIVTHHGVAEQLGDSLVLRIRQAAAPVTVASTIVGGERYLLVRARPIVAAALTTAPPARPKRWIVLDDTSASRGPTELRAQAALIDRLVDDIDEHDQVMVIAFDATHRRFGPWQDALAIDRRALASFLAKDAGLGETDLGEALEGAVKLLDGEPGYIVYVGDGTATGEHRTIDELRDAIVGKQATFVGLGVGDGAELPVLSALADATAGIATTIDLGDDLAWRSLDLVASLYTTRITGLTATIDGASAGAVSYLRSTQVAAGEDVELIVKAPARDDFRTIVLRGDVGGQPWSQTIAVGSAPRAPGDGGYLPRMWAQRRLEALMTAGDRAMAPCTTTPCPSDEQRAITAYHTRKAEMVALGTEFFLLSPHTSLIVLENDAMYARYGVRKGDGATWAPYALPPTLVTTAVPVAPPVRSAEAVWRDPTPWRYDTLLGTEVSDFTGAAGLGVTGALGHAAGNGNGTGQGYGQGFGRRGTAVGGGGRVETKAVVGGVDKGKIAAGEELDDAPMAKPAEALPPAPPARSGPSTSGDRARAEDEADADADPDRSAPAPAAVATPDLESAPTGNSAPAMGLAAATPAPDPAPVAPQARSVVEAEPTKNRDLFERAVVRSRGRVADGFAAESPRWSGGGLQVTAFQSSSDWRLDDLTEWLPGFMRNAYDDLAAGLDDGAGAARGSITPDAERAVAAARAKLTGGRWRLGADAELVIDGRGRFEQRTTLDSGVEEIRSYDGSVLRYRYPQLGLATERRVGDHAPALYAAVLPIYLPRADQLARWYRVTLSGTRTLVLAPLTGSGSALELELSDDGVIASLRRKVGADTETLITTVREGAGFRVTLGGGAPVAVTYSADPSVEVATSAVDPVSIEVPTAALAVARQAVAVGAGDPGWRHAQHQRAASALAERSPGELAEVLRELAARGPLSMAELALLGGGVRWVRPGDLDAAIGSNTGAVVDYLRLLNRYRADPSRADFGPLATAGDGLVGALASYRQVVAAADKGDQKAALTAFRRFADRQRLDVLRIVGATRLASQFAWRDPSVLSALDDVAAGPWRNLAREEAARLASGSGRRGQAADRWIALMSDVDLTVAPPGIDWTARQQVENSARGTVGWQLAMGAWRQRVLAEGDFAHVMAFARAAALVPDGDLDVAIDRAAVLAGDEVAEIIELSQLAASVGRSARAQTLIDDARARRPGNPQLLRLASSAARQRGEATAAAEMLTRALAAEADRPVSLTQLQTDYATLIILHQQAAVSASGAQRDLVLGAALQAGRDWRAMDPDNAMRERLLGELLLAVGQDDEAWRYLSSPIDRAPREGASFQGAAEVLERQGKLDRALGLWRRAFAIDATNPTWLQRQAMVELALGRRDAAKATLQRLLGRSWHVRWDGVTWWAKDALRSL